jgi:hypothetical protein
MDWEWSDMKARTWACSRNVTGGKLWKGIKAKAWCEASGTVKKVQKKQQEKQQVNVVDDVNDEHY